MLRFVEFMTGFYWLLLPEFIFGNLRRGRWRATYAGKGHGGLVGEFTQGLLGANAIPFYVSLEGAWSGYAIQRLLKQHNISTWGWGFAFNEMFFHVHRDDAGDAQQVLLSAGVELLG